MTNPNGATVLVVDDDPGLISDYLGAQGIKTFSVGSGRDTLRYCERNQPDLILLDLELDREDGLDVLRCLRSRSDVPVIVTTGYRRDEIDRVVGLELGADDYLTKPFGLRELLARIRAVMRRHAADYAHRKNEGLSYHFGGWVLRTKSRQLYDPAGAQVSLTKGEHALLVAFLDAPQRVLSREYLLQTTRVHEDIFDRSIDVQILRLRRKLESDASAPRVIVTQRGAGYVFDLPVERL